MFKLPKHPVLNFEIWSFEFVSNFGYRASDLSLIPLTSSELRICDITNPVSQHIKRENGDENTQARID